MRAMPGVSLRHQWIADPALIERPDTYAEFSPQVVYIPMQQHTGAPCKPVVQAGDEVLLGQLIGKSDGNMSANVHASVSGAVLAVEEHQLANGGMAQTVLIENDGLNRPAASIRPYREETPPDAEEIRKAVHNAGIVGMGGATFPTHIKLDVGDKKVDTLILNGAECEPGIYADNALMCTHADRILAGALAAMQAVGAKTLLTGIEERNPEAVRTIRHAHGGAATVTSLPQLYPQGGEKQLVQALTGREIPEGGLPADAGVVVLNVGTALAIAEALYAGAPLTHRVCTVTGDVRQPQNLRYPLGTLPRDLLDFCGGFSGTPSKIIIGGPMMGDSVTQTDIPLTKGSNGLVVVGEDHDMDPPETPCIRCNRCVEVCPMYLVPYGIDRYWRKDDVNGCHRLHAQSCINCGCCTYICPAARHLAENIVQAKNELQEREKTHGQ